MTAASQLATYSGLDKYPSLGVRGVIEAKKAGEALSGVENQSKEYACHLPDYVKNWQMPLPFIYETTGIETFFTPLFAL